MVFVPPLNCSAKGDINNVGFIGYPVRGSTGARGTGLYSVVTEVGATISIENKNGVVRQNRKCSYKFKFIWINHVTTGYVTYLFADNDIDDQQP